MQGSIIDKTIKSQSEAQARADSDIARLLTQVTNLKFYTLKPGLIVGQTLTINSSIFRG